jgi:outer membrane protein assembly factor BamA
MRLIRHRPFILFAFLLFTASESLTASAGCGNDTLIVSKITVIGNNITRESIVLRELTVSVGDTVFRDELERRFKRSEDNLFNTRLFNSADINWIEDSCSLMLYVILSERWYFFPLPIFEVAERNFNTWWETRDFSRVVYGMSLNWRNVSGRNDVVTTTVRLGYTQRLSLGYSIPNINRKKTVGFGFSGYYLRNREVQIETAQDKQVFLKVDDQYMRKEYGGGIGLSYRPGLYESQSGELYYRHSATTDTAVRFNPDYFVNGDSILRYFSLRYIYRLNHQDISVYPTKGYLFEEDAVQSGFKFIGDDIDLLSVSLRFKQFNQLGRRWFSAASFTGKLTSGSRQPYYVTRALGYGKEVIRGYEYYVIDGQHFVLLKSGLKFALIPKKEFHAGFIPSSKFNVIPMSLYAGVYFDAGYVSDDQFTANNRLRNSWQYGYGAGFDLFTFYDLVFRFEYSFNKLGESGFFIHFTTSI